MTKLGIEDIKQALNDAGVEPEKQTKVIQNLEQVAEEEKQEKEASKEPKAKNEFGVVLFAPDLVGKEYTATIYQIKQGDDHSTVIQRLSAAARSQNESAKRKKNALTTLGEVFQSLKRKFSKEKGVAIKTKEQVRVLISDNKLV